LLSEKKLALIGAGQMGEALLRGFLDAGVLTKDQVILTDVNEDRLQNLKSEYGVGYALDTKEAVGQSDIVLLAVKPQQIQQVIEGFRSEFKSDGMLISIAAGVTTQKLQKYLDKEVSVIRVMPNTPALVGEAMSVLCRGEFADDAAMEISLKLFDAVGKAVELPEHDIDKVTAVSGSGPAYFFLLVESLIEAGVNAGLSRENATILARQTFLGSAVLLESSEKSAGELREMVTSPGGTTAAALQVFYDQGFASIVQAAVNAAVKRAGELA
jgi:pyrroline-5-carboxylate reductase